MRGLATLPQDGSRSLQWSATGMEDAQEDPLTVHCLCLCSGSALLGDFLGVSRSRERDLLTVLLIYPRIFLHALSRFILIYVDQCWLFWFSCQYLPHFRLAASVLWCWSWEKEGRAVDVVAGIYTVHRKIPMCTATRTSSYSPVGPIVFLCVSIFSLGLCFACSFVLFDLFVCPFFCVSLSSWVISLTVFWR